MILLPETNGFWQNKWQDQIKMLEKKRKVKGIWIQKHREQWESLPGTWRRLGVSNRWQRKSWQKYEEEP